VNRRGRLALAAVSTAAIGAAALGGWRLYRSHAGEPSDRLADTWNEGHRVLDRRGRLLRELASDTGQRGRTLPLAEIGDRLVLATLVSEDKSFYEHGGVDARAIGRATLQNVRHARLVSGASTITQQLVKILDTAGQPHPKSLAEKLQEAARAQNLEQKLTKEEILEAYVNRLPYGHGLVGPEAAAQGYFAVSSRNLSWAQAAFLAVLPRAPSYLDPYVHVERVTLRQRALLEAMRDEGVLSEVELERAKGEPLSPHALARPFFAPHFVEELRKDSRVTGGVTRTTLDLDLQRDVEGLVRTHLADVEDKKATDAGMLVVDNATGHVLAHVGSADFRDEEIAGQVDMVRSLRQPGSTLKPFVYALAFRHGHTGAEMLADVPTSFSEDGRGAYAPANFDGGYAGPISAREALAGSLNVPAIRLASELRPGELLGSLHELGFASLGRDAAHYGLALALGSGEVTLEELAGAYVTLARGGDAIPLRRVADDPPGDPTRVMDAGIAALVAETLSDPLARVRGLHGQGPFDLGFPVAVKTGTSSGFRDTWSVGFTHERTVAVWVGNADGSPMLGLTGASGAGPLFADAMRRAMRDVPRRAPLWDESLLVATEVCPLSGKLPGPACPDHATRRFVRGHVPEHTCDMHVHVAPRPEAHAGEAPWRCDPRGSRTVVVLPDVFDAWLGTQPAGAPGQDAFGIPWFARSRVAACSAGAGEVAELRVETPAPGSVFVLAQHDRAESQMIELSASLVGGDAGSRPGEVMFVLDGRTVARSRPPFRARIPATAGDHEVLALPTDPGFPVRLQASRYSVR